MRPGITAILVLSMGLSCHAQSDDAVTWLEVLDCEEKAEDVEHIEDLDEQCKTIIENAIKEREDGRWEWERQEKEKAKRFQLYNGCLPMNLIVEELSDDAKEIGLSREAIQNTLESRLRGAHLYATPENSYENLKRANLLFRDKGFAILNISQLYVRVSVFNRAFAITVAYRKWIMDDLSEIGAHATTWETGSLGIAKSDGFIMNYLAEHMDQFLVEFLRVNEADCQPSRHQTPP